MRVNILSPGAKTPNGAAFLFPLWIFKDAFRDRGVDLIFFNEIRDEIADCDTLLVDSKFHRSFWAEETEEVLSQFSRWSEKTRVVYCDTTDSTGSLQAELLPHIHIYAKSQLLKEKTQYSEIHYAERLFADYYHREFGFTDVVPSYSKPVVNPEQLKKLRLSWNSGFGDHSFSGPFIGLIMRRFNLRSLARFGAPIATATARRDSDISCRFGNNYLRKSVGAQRTLLSRIIGVDTSKLGRRAYLYEMARSKIVLSPFGLGEITLKDFEAFLCGALLLKPNMSHMETWPNFYVPDVTIKTHNWELEGIKDLISYLLANDGERQDIASSGQRLYYDHTLGPNAGEIFSSHFLKMVAEKQ